MSTFKAILLLGGAGERFCHEKPKQFHRLSGKKVYLHTLSKFIELDRFSEIILVVHPHFISEVQEDVKGLLGIKVVPGGNSRQASSYLGLLACGSETDYVMIHDAVRPFVSKRILIQNIETAQKFGAVDTCAPSFDTIVVSEREGVISSIPNRAHYLRGQTPQTFRYDWILQAHKHALDNTFENISDDCRLVLEWGEKVHIVQGDEENIKITTQLDLFIAEQLIRLHAQSALGNNEGSLQGKRYAIIGGTGGIGSAIAKELTDAQAEVVVLSRSSVNYPLDIRDKDQVKAMFAKIGALDGLINSAGFLMVKPLENLSFEEIQEQLQTNLHGVIYSCKCAQLKKGAHIVNIASSSFTRGRMHSSIYSGAKSAVVNFTQALADERDDLNVNVIVPQRTNTAMRKKNFPDENEATLLDPSQIALSVVNLLKGESITGQIIEVRKD